MKIGIMAAGGVGAYYGGVLTEAGRDVWLVARGPNLETLQRNGLRITSVGAGERTVAVHAGSPTEAGVCDLVLFCVKRYATKDAVRDMLPMVGPETTILCVQNGADAAERLQEELPPEFRDNVLWGLTYIVSHMEGPGAVSQLDGPRRIVFGEGAGGDSERGRRVHETLDVPGIDAVFSEYVHRNLWNKFMFINGLAGMTAVTHRTLGYLKSTPEAWALLNQVVDEVEAIGRASGVDLDGEREDVMGYLGRLGPETRSSMAVDVLQGNRLEVDSLHGTVGRMGRELGIETPACDFIHAVLKTQDPGAQPAP
ncbi:MAG: 2-dehydropantoate 2-reductase [Chloroflexi bacterium]|nr:2-dehydropantoate 2-reductase [Chloroflexota bacterium]